jgi:hypothetical protein
MHGSAGPEGGLEKDCDAPSACCHVGAREREAREKDAWGENLGIRQDIIMGVRWVVPYRLPSDIMSVLFAPFLSAILLLYQLAMLCFLTPGSSIVHQMPFQCKTKLQHDAVVHLC